MKLPPSLSHGGCFKRKLLLSLLLTTVIPFFLFLLSYLLINPHPSGKFYVFPFLIFVICALGLCILSRQKILFSFGRLSNKTKEIHPTAFNEQKTKDELSLRNNYPDTITERLKEKDQEIKDVKNRSMALNAIATAVNQTLDVDRILNEVLEIVLEVTHFDGGIIFLTDEENGSLLLRTWKGLEWDSLWKLARVKSGNHSTAFSVTEDLVAEAIKRKQIIFISNLEENQPGETHGSHHRQLKDLSDTGIKTLHIVPFVAKGAVFGAVTLVSLKPREPNLEENEFLEAIGQQVGMAIDNINLLSAWGKKAHDLSLLLEISNTFSVSLNLSQVLDVLTRKIMKTLDVELCWTALVDQDGKSLIFETFSSSEEAESSTTNSLKGGMEKGKSILMEHLPLHHKVVQTGRTIKIRKEEQLTLAEKDLLPGERRGETILLPLSIRNRMLGIVGVGLKASEKLKLENLNLCQSMVSQAAFAIENARLYEDVKQKAEEAFSLYQVAQRLSSILDVDELLNQVLKVIVESFGYLNCAILLADKNKKELFVKASHGFPDERMKNIRIKTGAEGVTGWVAQTGEPVVVGDVSKDPRYVMGMEECQSEIAVPLLLKGEIIGVINAESEKPFVFGEKDVRILSQLASQIAIVLENSRLFSEEKKRYVQLALINDVGRKVVSTLNLDQLLETTAEVIQLSLKYDHISLFLLDESSGELVLKTLYGKSSTEIKPGYHQRKGVGMVGKAAESGKTVLCNDVTKEPTYIPAIEKTMSELSVPIKKGKMILGVLDVENFVKDTFDKQDVAVLETVADLLSTAINNTKLYEDTKRKAHRLELTDQINRAISSTLDLEGIFHIVCGELNKIMECDRICLNFWYPQEYLFQVEMAFCPKEDLSLKAHQSIPADDTCMYEVVQTKKPYYREKLVIAENCQPMDRLIFSEGIRSYMLIPVINNDEVIGVLSLDSKKERGFGSEQIELLNSIAGHLSVAIQNATLFSDLEEAYQNLKNTHSHMIQIERFRAFGEMASGVVHDFNNVLASILGRVQLLLLKLKKEGANPSDGIVKSLEVIEKSATDGAKMLSRIREFTKEKPQTDFCPIDPNQVVEDSLEMTRAYRKDRILLPGVRIEIKRDLKAKGMVMGAGTELREVLTNLILNAVDAMPGGGALTLKTEEDEKFVFLTVGDTGMGMTEEVKSKIFVPFFTTKGKDGTGLGLSLAHGIITRHKGEFTVESAPGLGSSFTIKLPRCNPVEKKHMPVTLPKGEGACVLVIEDEKNIREVLDEILSTAGHTVSQATNGEEGIKLFHKHKADIVITDLGMPGLSGWEVANKIKESDPDIPVILSTGWGVKVDQNEIHKKNVDRIISKPFNMEQILNLISELLSQRKSQKMNV